MNSKVIEKNGKFYIQLLDGEVEMTKERFEKFKQSNERLKDSILESSQYFKRFMDILEKAKDGNNSIMRVDNFIDTLLPVLDMLYADENKTERAKKVICYILQILISNAKENIVNPSLKENIDANRYLLSRLETVHTLWLFSLPLEKENKIEKPKAPVIALFCKLLSDSKIRVRGDESAEAFCKKICKEFNLDYTENVRQNYSGVRSINLDKMRKLIYPFVDAIITEKLEDYLANQK